MSLIVLKVLVESLVGKNVLVLSFSADAELLSITVELFASPSLMVSVPSRLLTVASWAASDLRFLKNRTKIIKTKTDTPRQTATMVAPNATDQSLRMFSDGEYVVEYWLDVCGLVLKEALIDKLFSGSNVQKVN